MEVACVLRALKSVITQMFFYACFEGSARLTEIHAIAVLARYLIDPGRLDGILVGWGTVMDEL